MVRAVADRAFLPTKNLLEQVGDMMILTGKTLLSAIRPPYPYGTEFVQQFLFALRLCWFPLMVSTIAFGYAAPGLQASNGPQRHISHRSPGCQREGAPRQPSHLVQPQHVRKIATLHIVHTMESELHFSFDPHPSCPARGSSKGT